MDPTYFTGVPQDVVELLLFRLHPDVLYQAYISLTAMRVYDDPNHRVWKQLYNRDISSYPLPPIAKYRDQYFWAIDHLKTHLDPIDLAKLGYDVPLSDMLLNATERAEVLEIATKGGYLNIIQNLLSDADGHYAEYVLMFLALRCGRQQVFDHLRERYELAFRDDWMYWATEKGHLPLLQHLISLQTPSAAQLIEIMFSAGKSGNWETILWVLSLNECVEMYTAGLAGAAFGGYRLLMEWMYQRGGQIQQNTLYQAACGGVNGNYSIDSLYWILERIDVIDHRNLYLLAIGWSPVTFKRGLEMYRSDPMFEMDDWIILVKAVLKDTPHVCLGWEMVQVLSTQVDLAIQTHHLVNEWIYIVSALERRSKTIDPHDAHNCSKKIIRALLQIQPHTR